MLPSSAWRWSLTSATGLAPSLAASAPRLAASAPLLSRQPRRYSSSKSSRSDSDSSFSISAGQSVSASATTRGGGKATSAKGKRKNHDRGAEAFKGLPSVPNTHHMSQEALSLSTFFSLHRPISISQTMPRSVTAEHFASIFAPEKRKPQETMSVLQNTIKQLEGPMASVTIDGDQAEQDGAQRFDVQNPDGSDAGLFVQMDAMSGDFSPYCPPPAPRPVDSAALATRKAVSKKMAISPLHRSFQAVFTIEESIEPDGQIHILAHSPRPYDEGQPRSFLERLALRQMRFDESRGRRELFAISVKRQRKLKMKKKKYKKLMKRTRNLRRKLDRT